MATLYQPSTKQAEFHAARKSAARRWFCGGRQSGKTEAGAAEAAIHALLLRPGGTGAIFAPTYGHALTARHRFEQHVDTSLRTWNGADRMWRVTSSSGEVSRVFLRSLSDPDAPRGLTLDWAWLDECAMYSEEAWLNLRPALAVKDAAVWGTSTPRGMNWLWNQAVQNPEDGDYLVHATSLDNPTFPQAEWDAMRERYGEDSPYFKQEVLGQFSSFVGQAVPQFDRVKHVGEYEWVKKWPLIRGWDFGWTAPTVALWIQMEPDRRRIYVLAEKLWTETERSAIVHPGALTAVDSSGNTIPWGAATYEYIDPSGAVGRAKEVGDPGWRDDFEKLGLDPRWTRRHSEQRGLNLIREFVRTDRLFIDQQCVNLINALETAQLSDDPEKDCLKDMHPATDCIDALRYALINEFGERSRPTFKTYDGGLLAFRNR